MGCTYRLRMDQIDDQSGTTHTVYGVELWEDGCLVRAVDDVFFDREKAEEFVSLCNRLQLSAVHLTDVIADAVENAK